MNNDLVTLPRHLSCGRIVISVLIKVSLSFSMSSLTATAASVVNTCPIWETSGLSFAAFASIQQLS